MRLEKIDRERTREQHTELLLRETKNAEMSKNITSGALEMDTEQADTLEAHRWNTFEIKKTGQDTREESKIRRQSEKNETQVRG